jgi:hypothetical protein
MMKDQTRAWTEIKRELHVVGTAWGGFRAKMTYPLKTGQEPKNKRDAKMIAGDFSDIECATVTVTTTIINQTLAQTYLT